MMASSSQQLGNYATAWDRHFEDHETRISSVRYFEARYCLYAYEGSIGTVSTSNSELKVEKLLDLEYGFFLSWKCHSS